MKMYSEHVGEPLRDLIQRLRETLLRGTKVLPARLSGKVQCTIYESPSLPPHRSEFVVRKKTVDICL